MGFYRARRGRGDRAAEQSAHLDRIRAVLCDEDYAIGFEIQKGMSQRSPGRGPSRPQRAGRDLLPRDDGGDPGQGRFSLAACDVHRGGPGARRAITAAERRGRQETAECSTAGARGAATSKASARWWSWDAATRARGCWPGRSTPWGSPWARWPGQAHRGRPGPALQPDHQAPGAAQPGSTRPGRSHTRRAAALPAGGGRLPGLARRARGSVGLEVPGDLPDRTGGGRGVPAGALPPHGAGRARPGLQGPPDRRRQPSPGARPARAPGRAGCAPPPSGRPLLGLPGGSLLRVRAGAAGGPLPPAPLRGAVQRSTGSHAGGRRLPRHRDDPGLP